MKNALTGFSFIIGAIVWWSLVTHAMSSSSDLLVFLGLALLWAGVYQAYRMIRNYGPELYATLRSWLPVVLLIVVGSGCTSVPPGYVGIRVNQYGSQRGVEDFPIVTGRVWYNPLTENIYTFPTFLQQAVWTKASTEGSVNDDSITFNSSEGSSVNADIFVAYSFDAAKVPELFVKFRRSAEDITHVYVRSQVRDAIARHASTMPITKIFADGKEKLMVDAQKDLNDRLTPEGMHIDSLSFVGSVRVDDRVMAAVNGAIQATQLAIQAENQVRQREAEAKQAIAVATGVAESRLINARAEAEANRLVAASVTPDLIQLVAAQKWNGVLPGVTGGAVPFVNLPSGK